MNLERYEKQAIFKHLSEEDQQKLATKKVAIVGLGGLGGIEAELLARAGVGTLILIDADYVEVSNLQRQILYNEDDIDMPKVIAAREHLRKVNSTVNYITHSTDINSSNISTLLQGVDLIVDGTDNMETRYILNEFALKNRTPFVHAAVAGSMGVVFNILPQKNTPCLQCLYPRDIVEQAGELANVDTSGILNMTVSMVGSLAALQAFKILLDKNPSEELIYVDIWKEDFQKIKVEKDAKCSACNGLYEFLSKPVEKVRKWGRNKYYVLPHESVDFDMVVKYLSRKGGKLKYNEYVLHYTNEEGVKISIFRDGRAIIKDVESPAKAKELYDTIISESSKLESGETQPFVSNRSAEMDEGRFRPDADDSPFAPLRTHEEGDEKKEDNSEEESSHPFFPNPFE